MKVFQCDGEEYLTGKPCEKTTSDVGVSDWLEIEFHSISNGLSNKHIDTATDGCLHFCSKECMNNYFFKNYPNMKELRDMVHLVKIVLGESGLDELEAKTIFVNEVLPKMRNYLEMLKDGDFTKQLEYL